MTQLFKVCAADGTSMGSWFAVSESVAIARAATKGKRTSLKSRAPVSGWTAKAEIEG